ncbi:MAG: hypothetical protein DHS20C17_19690 [Cyclobacteriaceae bacterium]|nr:MAG: hypothetical protein DHS20C17_19690 [Cyclobacteriaceae bacterium]
MSRHFAGVFLLLLLFLSQHLFAQRFSSKSKSPRGSIYSINKKYSTFGVSVNAMNYFGDIAPKKDFSSTDLALTRPGFGLFFTRRLGPKFSTRVSLNWGRIKGDDYESADPADDLARYRYVRNLQFRNDIKELSVVGVFDFAQNLATYRSRKSVVPYIFAGVAVFHHNPKAQVPDQDVNNGNAPFPEAGDWVALPPLMTEGNSYKKVQLAIPFGLGLRFKLDERWDLAFEAGYRHLFFDYIDDVSGDYVDLGSLSSDLARALSDRSREVTAVESGETRQTGVIPNRMESYISTFDGNTYTTIAGYGRDAIDNIRGNHSDKDIYIMTGFQVSYVIPNSRFKRAKFR